MLILYARSTFKYGSYLSLVTAKANTSCFVIAMDVWEVALKIGPKRQIEQILTVLPLTNESILLPSFRHRVGMECTGSHPQKVFLFLRVGMSGKLEYHNEQVQYAKPSHSVNVRRSLSSCAYHMHLVTQSCTKCNVLVNLLVYAPCLSSKMLLGTGNL